MKKFLTTLLLVVCLLTASVACAEVKTYTGEGTYVMSEGENLGISKERAKADAMRNAAEKAGTYVKSYSRTVNLELDEDVIETMTANILKLVEDPHFFPLETVDNLEGVLIRVTVKVQIDDADITRWLKKDSQEISTLVSQMEALKKSNDELARQNAELKKQLAGAKTQDDKERITQEFAAEDKKFLSNQKDDEAWKLYEKQDFEGAKNLFVQAIELNPDNSRAWFGLGNSCMHLRQYERAIIDFSRAIKLNPNWNRPYTNRGYVYDELKQYERAIQDYNKAIQLNPNDSLAYFNRSTAYSNLGQYDRAIQDCNKAIEISPNYVEAYGKRGAIYLMLGNFNQVIVDATKAIQLNPNYAKGYGLRAIGLSVLKQYDRALQDFNRAIQLEPNNAVVYHLRGGCYQQLGDNVKAQADFAKAKALGYNG